MNTVFKILFLAMMSCLAQTSYGDCDPAFIMDGRLDRGLITESRTSQESGTKALALAEEAANGTCMASYTSCEPSATFTPILTVAHLQAWVDPNAGLSGGPGIPAPMYLVSWDEWTAIVQYEGTKPKHPLEADSEICGRALSCLGSKNPAVNEILHRYRCL